MKIGVDFVKLNRDWGFHERSPELTFVIRGEDLIATFRLKAGPDGDGTTDRGILRFVKTSFHRFGPPNEQEWRSNQCRYRQKAIEWGHFYEVIGEEGRRFHPRDWVRNKAWSEYKRHFLIYLANGTFECVADRWFIEPVDDNALFTRAVPLVSGDPCRPDLVTAALSRTEKSGVPGILRRFMPAWRTS